MPRFFTGEVDGETALIHGEDARHMALSLRMKTGEAVTVCDAKGNDYQCEIVSVQPEEVVLRIRAAALSQGEPGVFITLYQAMPKGDKLEQIVQKAVELGVGRVVPVLTSRCISRPDEGTMEKKRVRLNRISQEAAKQCGRGLLPEVAPMLRFEEAVLQMKESALPLFFYENATDSLKTTISKKLQKEVSILIGSEGGFSAEEADFGKKQGLLAVSLGSRILRCETAPLAAIAAVLYEAGEI